jgi:hypothetical protein
MWKFLKTTEADDAITTEEVLVVVLAEVLAEVVQVAIEVLLQEEKETLLQDVKVLVADLEATEVLLHVKVVLDQEAHQLQELAVSLKDLQDLQKLQDVMAVLQKDQQDVLKALVTHQEKKDQEEVNTFC